MRSCFLCLDTIFKYLQKRVVRSGEKLTRELFGFPIFCLESQILDILNLYYNSQVQIKVSSHLLKQSNIESIHR